jgi:PTS system mannose-specific IIB component/fructoselysine and glucoselysine-specific PTS system IIB component
MAITLYRIDDRLIHGQVVVGWDLYRMGVPPEMEIVFADVATAIKDHDGYVSDSRRGILVTPDIPTMQRLVYGVPYIREVNVGGIHHRAGRAQKLRYVFLAPDEEVQLRAMVESGVKVTAQDVPAAREVPMSEVLGPHEPEARSA